MTGRGFRSPPCTMLVMALVTERIKSIRTDWLTLDVTYDDVTLDLDRIVVTCASPFPIDYELYRRDRAQPWRSGTITDGQVLDEQAPIGGGFRTLDQLQGMGVVVPLEA